MNGWAWQSLAIVEAKPRKTETLHVLGAMAGEENSRISGRSLTLGHGEPSFGHLHWQAQALKFASRKPT